MSSLRSLALFSLLGAASAVAQPVPVPRAVIRVENPLALIRRDETVTVSWSDLQRRLAGLSAAKVRVLDREGREIASQVVDDDGDGVADALIFQGDFGDRETRHFTVEAAAPTRPYAPQVAVRHDEPRDDIAWESDRVAFRIYGEGLKKTSSAMSSAGIDVWNKKTRALIVEKWYGKGHDSYHVDTGEGADFYDVGETLGNGGVAGWKNDTIWRPDNFKKWRVIAAGPIRVVFELTYDGFNVGGTLGLPRSFDFGLPFFFGRTVFVAVTGAQTPKGVGPYWAY